MNMNLKFKTISKSSPAYFIADIGANHNGSVQKAIDLIYLAKEAGADCAKFQHFKADKIVSDRGFSNLGGQIAHQKNWKSSVYDIYDEFHTRREWDEALIKACSEANIEFMTTPYDIEAVQRYAPHCSAFKIGSGDIDYFDLLEEVLILKKPILLSTGASTFQDVTQVAELVEEHGVPYCMMQCNTNYTGSDENVQYTNLNVLKLYQLNFPNAILGLSDHTFGCTTVLGAVALGATVIEKHFTDSNSQEGPDHSFAMNPETWREMVDKTRELESALGDGVKRVEPNEKESSVVQRRALRTNKPLKSGTVLKKEDVEALRPCPVGAVRPSELKSVLGKKITRDLESGEELLWDNLIT